MLPKLFITSHLRGFLLSAMKTLFASFRLSLGGIKANGVLIVENVEADRLTHMGYRTY